MEDYSALLNAVKAPYSKEFKKRNPSEARILEVEPLIYAGMAEPARTAPRLDRLLRAEQGTPELRAGLLMRQRSRWARRIDSDFFGEEYTSVQHHPNHQPILRP
jgi:hypothetical protein